MLTEKERQLFIKKNSPAGAMLLQGLSERYAYANTYYFDAMDSLARLIEKSVKAQRRESAEEASIEGAWLVFVRTIEDAKSLQLALKALDCSSVIIFSQFTKRYDGRITNRKKHQAKYN